MKVSSRKTTRLHTGKSVMHGNKYSVPFQVKVKKFRPIELTEEQTDKLVDQLMASRITRDQSVLEQVLADNLVTRPSASQGRKPDCQGQIRLCNLFKR